MYFEKWYSIENKNSEIFIPLFNGLMGKAEIKWVQMWGLMAFSLCLILFEKIGDL